MKPTLYTEIPATIASNYPIWIGNQIFSEFIDYLSQKFLASKIAIITDNKIIELYNQIIVDLKNSLQICGCFCEIIIVPHGENNKSRQMKDYLEDKLFEAKFDKSSILIAFGGGVVGDLTGFVAATYMRGINYIQVPTTLLAMVDSSIGGKTAINTKYGKNLIGAIWQPQSVFVDLSFINTLPHDHFISGLVEALKIFIIRDADMFGYFCDNLPQILNKDLQLLYVVIKNAIKLKSDVVNLDEKEQNLRMILNFGHTIGHALEFASDYKLLHGYAVGLGIIIECKIAVMLGILSVDIFTQIVNILNVMGITPDIVQDIDMDKIVFALYHDKKRQDNSIICCLIKDIGKVYITNNNYVIKVDEDIILLAISEILVKL